MNTIIKIYIYNVLKHETIQSNQNIEKSPSGKSSFKSSLCAMILYGFFSFNPFLTVPVTVKQENIFFLFHSFFFLVLGFIQQSSIIRTQTVITIQLCSCWKVEVVSIKIFQIFFETYRVLTIFSAGKFQNDLVTIFTELMVGFHFVPRNICTNMVQNSADRGLQLIMFTASTHSQREYCPFFQH